MLTSPAVEPRPLPATTAADRPTRHYVMCPPSHFDVVYRINAWMHPHRAVDRARAGAQWARLRGVLESLGHRVDEVEPADGLPDMVFAANSALVIGGRAVAASMAAEERRGEERHYRSWLAQHGLAEVRPAANPNEGEGDFVVVGGRLLGGTGFRTSAAAHDEVAEFFGLEVETLVLRDPRWYHLDTALFALDATNVAYHPGAFSDASRARLEELYPDALRVTKRDALVFGCNSISDGHHVVVSHNAKRLIAELRERGFEPIPLDTSEFHRAGGSAKCCVLELHPPTTAA